MSAGQGIVDCHFHVVAPQQQFPMLPSRGYSPQPASLPQWRQALGPAGVTHGVVVQPSFYGTDCRVLMAALAEGRGCLVGVAAVDEQVSDVELDRLVAAGVRGVRVAHFAAGDPRALPGFVPFSAFDALEGRLADRGLHLQLFTDSRLLPGIADRLVASRVPVVIDHMGRAPASLGSRHEGILALIALMREGPCWVKLSGIANISQASPGHEDARAVHEALVDAAPHRLVWGSDWPHTKPSGPQPSTLALLQLFLQWTPTEWHERILCANARTLYRLPVK